MNLWRMLMVMMITRDQFFKRFWTNQFYSNWQKSFKNIFQLMRDWIWLSCHKTGVKSIWHFIFSKIYEVYDHWKSNHWKDDEILSGWFASKYIFGWVSMTKTTTTFIPIFVVFVASKCHATDIIHCDYIFGSKQWMIQHHQQSHGWVSKM